MMQYLTVILGMLGGPAVISQHVSRTVALKVAADIYSAVDPMDLIEFSPYGKSASDAPSQDAICRRLTKV